MTGASKGVILMTGGTHGLGYETTKVLSRENPDLRIVIASRSDKERVTESINAATGNHNVEFEKLDLSDLASVRSFAETFRAQNQPPIKALIMNAALQFPHEIRYTADGYERTFGISHVGHALLFFLIRPCLADDARIVIVSSGTHDPEQKSGVPDAVYNTAEEMAHPSEESAKAPGRKRYSSTKLANVLFCYALHRRFQAINKRHGKQWTVTAIDPGLMLGTGLAREASAFTQFLFVRLLPRMIPLLRLLVSPNIHTPHESSIALARLATSPDVKGRSGIYFEGHVEIKSSKDSYNESKQEDLWKWSVETLAKDEEEKKMFDLVDLA